MPQDPKELFGDMIDFVLDQAAYQGADAWIDFRQLYGRYDNRLGKRLVRQLEQSTQLQAEILASAERANQAMQRIVRQSVTDITRRYGPR